ncbi:hypothetical protein KDL44_03425 [bacterium]|nr:hypothetical protein [bacterium]
MKTGIRTAGVVISSIAMLAMLAGGCGGVAPSDKISAVATTVSPDLQDQIADSVNLDDALREIAALETPEDVDAEVFNELKAELARLLGEPQSEAPERTSSAESEPKPEYFDLDNNYIGLYESRPSLEFNEADNTITASYNSAADYDRNGIVSPADLVPLSRNLGTPVFTQDLAVLDGDGNGWVNLGDIVPIARHMGQPTTKMYLYASTDAADYSWDGQQGPDIEPLMELPLSAASRFGKSGKLDSFVFSIADPQPGIYYWAQSDTALRPSQIDINRLNSGHASITNLRYDRDSGVLFWEYYQYFDWDNNQTVTISDMLGFGVYWSVVDYAEDDQWRRSMDINSDGHLGMADFVMITRHFGLEISSLNVYVANSPQAPDLQMTTGSDVEPYATFSLQDISFIRGGTDDAATDYITKQLDSGELVDEFQNHFLWQAVSLPDLPSGSWLWIRPNVSQFYAGPTLPGQPSDVIQIP